MNTVEYIERLLSDDPNPNESDFSIFKALVNTLSYEDKDKLRYSNFRIRDYIDWTINPRNEKKAIHYKSWKEYFNDIVTRKRGVYYKSRQPLMQIFPHIEWKGQLKITEFLISSEIMTERRLGFKQLSKDWSLIADLPDEEKNIWQSKITKSWEKYQDSESGLLILKRLSLPYIKQWAEQLIAKYGYAKVAVRLAEDKDYEVDLLRMSEKEYLYAMAKTNRKVPYEYCKLIMQKTIRTACLSDSKDYWYYSNYRRGYSYSLLSVDSIRLLVWCFGKLGQDDLIIEFYEFDKQIQEALSQRFSNTSRIYIENNIHLYLNDVYGTLSKQKKNLMQRLTEENPALDKLIKSLDLKPKSGEMVYFI